MVYFLRQVFVYIFASVLSHSETTCMGGLQIQMNRIGNKLTTASQIVSCPSGAVTSNNSIKSV